MPVPIRMVLLSLLMASLAIGCARDRSSAASLAQTLALPPGAPELLGAITLDARPLEGPAVYGREYGRLRANEQGSIWIDPGLGVALLDLDSVRKGTGLPLPSISDRLAPRAEPVDAVWLDGAVVVQTRGGIAPVELFIEEAFDKEDPSRQWESRGGIGEGEYAAIAEWGSGVLGYDAAANTLFGWRWDAQAKTLTQTWSVQPPGTLEAIATQGKYLAGAGRDQEGAAIWLWDCERDPAGPFLINRWNASAPEPFSGLLWHGDGLLAGQAETLHLFKRDAKEQLALLGSAIGVEALTPIAAAGRYVWVRTHSGISVCDLETPTEPRLLSEPQRPLASDSPVLILGTHLWYVARGGGTHPESDGITLHIDFPEPAPDPRSLTRLRALDLTAPSANMGVSLPIVEATGPRSVAVYKNHLYVARGREGLAVYQFAPRQGRLLAEVKHITTLEAEGELQDVELVDHYLYCSNAVSGFQVFDLRVPEAPRPIPQSHGKPSGAGLLRIMGRRVFAAGTKLSLAQLTQPGVLTIGEDFPLDAPAQGAAVRGNFAYIACGEGGLYVLDLGSPNVPVIVENHIRAAGQSWGPLAVHGDYLIAAMNGTELAVWDMTRNLRPVTEEVQVLNGQITDLAMDGDRLWVGVNTAGGYGVARGYQIKGDGTLSWQSARLMPGPVYELRPAQAGLPALAVWSRGPGNAGVVALPKPAHEFIRITKRLEFAPPQNGPWLVAMPRFWTSEADGVTLRRMDEPDLPRVSGIEGLEIGWVGGVFAPGTVPQGRFHSTGQGALYTFDDFWVHLRDEPGGQLYPDYWPLAASEEVLDAVSNVVLLWDGTARQLSAMTLQSGAPPQPLSEQGWLRDPEVLKYLTHVEDAAIVWPTSITAALGSSGGGVMVAGGFAGVLWLPLEDKPAQLGDLRAMQVARGPGEHWAIAGDVLGTRDHELMGEDYVTDHFGQPMAVVRFMQGGREQRVAEIPALPTKLLMPDPDVAVTVWSEGIGVVHRSGKQETFAGAVEDVQLGPGWGDAVPGGTLVARFHGDATWYLLEVR